jgi:hypothetical protein
MALGSDWSMKGWTKSGESGVTLQEAFGIKKGTVKFPTLSAQLPAQVASAKGQAKGGSGARGGPVTSPGGAQEAANQKLGQQMVTAAGWGSQWAAFNEIVMLESGWNTAAANPSGAYGIPQALPGSKMAAAGPNWQTSAKTQIAWMIGYIRSRYGNPNNALAFHLANGWY